MKRKISLTTLAMIFFACVSLAPAARAQACSLALTAGKWGFTTNGTVVGIGTRVSVGILTFDAAGNVLNGKVTASLNGSITNETASGTYTVNPDCTGTGTFDIFDQVGNKVLTIAAAFVFDDNVRKFRAIFTSAVLPNGTPLAIVITADGRKLFPESSFQQ